MDSSILLNYIKGSTSGDLQRVESEFCWLVWSTLMVMSVSQYVSKLGAHKPNAFLPEMNHVEIWVWILRHHSVDVLSRRIPSGQEWPKNVPLQVLTHTLGMTVWLHPWLHPICVAPKRQTLIQVQLCICSSMMPDYSTSCFFYFITPPKKNNIGSLHKRMYSSVTIKWVS